MDQIYQTKLPHKHKGKGQVLWHMLVFGRQGQQGSWGSLAILAGLVSSRPMMTPCLKKQYGWLLRNNTCSWPLASTWHKSFTHSRLHTHTNTHPRVLGHLFFFTKGFSVLPIVASSSLYQMISEDPPTLASNNAPLCLAFEDKNKVIKRS